MPAFFLESSFELFWATGPWIAAFSGSRPRLHWWPLRMAVQSVPMNGEWNLNFWKIRFHSLNTSHPTLLLFQSPSPPLTSVAGHGRERKSVVTSMVLILQLPYIAVISVSITNNIVGGGILLSAIQIITVGSGWDRFNLCQILLNLSLLQWRVDLENMAGGVAVCSTVFISQVGYKARKSRGCNARSFFTNFHYYAEDGSEKVARGSESKGSSVAAKTSSQSQSQPQPIINVYFK